MQALARKARGLILEFTGGDPGIAQSLRTMYQSEGQDKVLSGHGYDIATGVWDFMQQASQTLGERGDAE